MRKQFIFSVMGRPVTKHRARVFGRGGRVSPSEWYERMVRDAFKKAYPNSKPFGSSFCDWMEVKAKKSKRWDWVMKNGVKETDLPKVQLDVIFYFESGKVGDADNLLKCIKDALNKVAYIDDRIVKKTTPYVVSVKEYDNIVYEDLEIEKEFGGLERVDIKISHFNLREDEYFKKLRRSFKNNSTIVDHQMLYNVPYHSWKKGDLEDECSSRGIKYVSGKSRSSDTKETLINKLIDYDVKEYEEETGKKAILVRRSNIENTLGFGVISYLKYHGVYKDFLKLLMDGEIDLKKEVWKTIDIEGVDLKHRYEISNYGRIRHDGHCGNSILGDNSHGYIRNRLSLVDGSIYNALNHRLVALHFINNDFDKDEVNHKFGIKSLNFEDCLEWSSRLENVEHALKFGLVQTKKIYKLDLDFNIVSVYNTNTECVCDNNESNVSTICRTLAGVEGLKRELCQAKGFRYMYKEDYENSDTLAYAKKRCGVKYEKAKHSKRSEK